MNRYLFIIRKQCKAKSIADIQYWVNRWSTTLGLGWDGDTTNDVSRYINKQVPGQSTVQPA